MFFWTLYIILSFVISFLVSRLFKSRLLKIFIFFISFGILTAIWFKNPGSVDLVPVISILFLENSILENNGLMRLLRPLSLFIIIGSFISLFIWILKSKS